MSSVECVVDERWWLGIFESVDKENNDIFVVSFMHPCGPSKFFNWPQREDKCHMNIPSVLIILRSLSTLQQEDHTPLQLKIFKL